MRSSIATAIAIVDPFHCVVVSHVTANSLVCAFCLVSCGIGGFVAGVRLRGWNCGGSLGYMAWGLEEWKLGFENRA